jgi:circadian clock protein KaiB
MKKDNSAPIYELMLYTTGAAPRSLRAVRNLVRFCRTHLPGRYRLRVVNLYDDPAEAARAQVVAVPTLVKLRPAPVRRVIGDMSDDAQTGLVLDVSTEPGP